MKQDARRSKGSAYTRSHCLIIGCSNLQRNLGKDYLGRSRWGKLCDKHHRLRFNIRNPFDNPSYFNKLMVLKHINNDKCELCGWNKGPCDRHRKVPKLGYTPGNLVILCPNCHRLLSLGIISL